MPLAQKRGSSAAPGIWARKSVLNSPDTVETLTPTFSNTRPRIRLITPPPPSPPSSVGRDQAVEKDGPALQNAMQGAALQKKEVENKESVRKTEDAKDGPDPVKERRGRQAGPEGKAAGGGEEGAEESDEEPREEVVRDPSLGNRVDLTG